MAWYYSPGDGTTYKNRCEDDFTRMEYQITKQFSQMDLQNVDLNPIFDEIKNEMLKAISEAREKVQAATFWELRPYVPPPPPPPATLSSEKAARGK